MNVNFGDIVMVIGYAKDKKSNGFIGEVISFSGSSSYNGKYGPCWIVLFSSQIPCMDVSTRTRTMDDLISIPDMFLRRICPSLNQLIPDAIKHNIDNPLTILNKFKKSVKQLNCVPKVNL